MNNSENHRFDHSETTSESQMSSQNLNSERNQSTQNSDYQQYNRSNQYTSQENNQIAKDEEQDERLMSMLIYLLGLFTSFIGPLVIWLVKRKDSKLIDTAGKTYLNYYISYFIYSVVAVILVYGFLFISTLSDNNTGIQIFALICMLILTLALLVLSIISIVCTIIVCVKYFSGKTYKIPFSIPIIK